MDFVLKTDPILRESIYEITHDSGLRIIVSEKDTPTSFANITFGFGSADEVYEKEGREYRIPAGTAHFLEHSMFALPDGRDAFALFDSKGGNPNAFTDVDNTSYHFSCSENFYDNLELLLELVTKPHFNKKTVAKEKPIITEEISMYDDSPDYRGWQALMNGMYKNHPVARSVAGSAESVASITPEILFAAHRDFYIPSNAVLSVCGSVDRHRVLEIADRAFSGYSYSVRPTTAPEPEQSGIVIPRAVSYGSIATPLFFAGCKCPSMEKNPDSVKKAVALKYAVSLLFGRSSDFYCKNYEKGLINERFSAGTEIYGGACSMVVAGSSPEPDRVYGLMLEEIEYRKKNFFSPESFEREKKVAYVSAVSGFDSPEDIVYSCIGDALYGMSGFDYIYMLRNITSEQVYSALCSMIDTKKTALSVVFDYSSKGEHQ